MTIKVKGQVALIEFKQQQYRNEIRRVLKQEIRHAIHAWLKAVIPHVPVYTGTAKGTLQKVGTRARPRIRLSKGPITHATRPELAKLRKTKRIGKVTYQLGFRAGDQYGKAGIIQESSKNEIIYTFTFEQELPYFTWNDIGRPISLPSNPPWFAIKAGNLAFENYARTQVKPKLPELLFGSRVRHIR